MSNERQKNLKLPSENYVDLSYLTTLLEKGFIRETTLTSLMNPASIKTIMMAFSQMMKSE